MSVAQMASRFEPVANDKENAIPRTPRTPAANISKRKSYSILSPIHNQRANNCRSNSPGKSTVNQEKDRIISESTGLIKLNLSPHRKSPGTAKSQGQASSSPSVMVSTNDASKSPTRSGLPFYIPSQVEQELQMDHASKFESKQDLLAQYAAQQQHLLQLESQVASVKRNLLEIAIHLRKFDHDDEDTNTDLPVFGKSQFNDGLDLIRKKTSSIFTTGNNNPSTPTANYEHQLKSLTKRASTMFINSLQQQNQDLENQFSSIKRRASTIFDTKPATDNNHNHSHRDSQTPTLSFKQSVSAFLPSPSRSSNTKFQSQENSNANIKTIFNEVKIKQEFDQFTNRTTEFVNGVWQKHILQEDTQNGKDLNTQLQQSQIAEHEDLANTSFNFENIKRNEDAGYPTIKCGDSNAILESSILLSGSDDDDVGELDENKTGLQLTNLFNQPTIIPEANSHDDSAVDIDDYNSSFED